MKAPYTIGLPIFRQQSLLIITVILVWYFLEHYFLHTGIPVLFIPIHKVVFLREKILKMALYPFQWNKNDVQPAQTDNGEKCIITTSVYTLPFWSNKSIKDHSLQDGDIFLSTGQPYPERIFKTIISQKTFLNASGERVYDQWRWVGSPFPHAIQHSSMILPSHESRHTSIHSPL